MKTILTLAALLPLILSAGCSTINDYGIGGEPVLVCKYRDGTAAIDDRLAGSDAVHGSVVRRFTDGDSLCAPLKVAPAGPAAAVVLPRALTESLSKLPIEPAPAASAVK